MNSIILQIAAKYLKPIFIVFSIFILFRGHNAPGGGFIGGLLAISGIIFYAFAYGVDKTRSSLYLKPKSFVILGILIAMTSAVIGFFSSKPILTGMWYKADLGWMEIKLGTPLLFDLGVYFVVIGAMLTITLSIMEELEWK